MLRKARVLPVVLITMLGLLVAVSPARAGTAWDYPEFPYQPTSYTEPSRGQFHFSARDGWMNDPNGLVHANGEYHFFFQHNPHGLEWDTMHWGHAVSPDLVHWTQKPIALEPGVQPGVLFSGNAVVDTHNTSGLRTGSIEPIVAFSNTDGVSVYYSNDNGKSFQAYDHGRKQIEIPVESRDPKVFWDAARGRWAMVVWSNREGNGVDVYTSPNLLDWTYASRYAAPWLFECPDLFPLPVDGNTGDQRWVLSSASSAYVVGSFDGTAFHTDRPEPKLMDLGTNFAGGSFYAASTFTNVPDGRVVQMAWQGGNRGSTWTGNATFPTALNLVSGPAGPQITRTPVAELDSLRADSLRWQDRTIDAASANLLDGVKADTYEITARFDVRDATARQFGFRLHSRADGSADRTVTYDRQAGTLYGKPLAPRDGKVTLRLLVDRGQLEIFGDGGRFSFSDNVNFDSSPASQGIGLFATGGSVRLDSATFTRLTPAWGTGESTLDSNLTGPWHAAGGTWTDTTPGKRADAANDAFYLSAQSGVDATYQGDVTLDSAQAAGLTFRANQDGAGYTVNVDRSGVVKLWRPGKEIATHATPITPGRPHHLTVRTAGPRITVWLDNGADPVIDATDTTYPSGLFGANVFHGTGTVQNLHLGTGGFTTFPAGSWTPRGGTWTVTPQGLRASSATDGFYLSDRTGTDFTYEGDLTVVNGVGAGLTFRATGDGTGYTATIDTGGLVKLWRPGKDIATYAAPIIEGRAHHVKVQTAGSRIRVWLDGGADPVIDATDAAYASGFVGVNAFAGNATANNLVLR